MAEVYLVNIALGNGLVPSGNKPLPEPKLTQFYGHNCLSVDTLGPGQNHQQDADNIYICI